MKWKTSGAICAVFLVTIWAAPTPFAVDDYLRLPNASVPTHYDLSITTSDLGQREFSGTVIINVDVIENTDVITLHNRGLSIDNVILQYDNDEVIEQTIEPDEEKEFLHIRITDGQILAGAKVSIEISFTGQLQLNSYGFYRSSYKKNGATR